MYEVEAIQLIDLLRNGQEAEAQALFMAHLLGHCRDIDQMVSECMGRERFSDDQLWEVFAMAYR